MSARALMIQGTGSDVGKSVIVAGLCRIAKRRGLRVAPFKPQNMSNNAAACETGGEIGRAQALQARAAGIKPHVDHNPVLLKPQSDRTSQLVMHGKAMNAFEAADYMAHRHNLMGAVIESFDRLAASNDLIIVEGAGSPAETNLRAHDIANMGFARKAGVPVCLVGDINKGGVIASLVGTKTVLEQEDAAMIIGFMVNMFRGDQALFDDGLADIERRTGWPSMGVIPWLAAMAYLPAEDAVTVSQSIEKPEATIRISAPMLSRMSNFDDADPLRMEPGIDFQWVPPGQPIPRNRDVIILFGSKSTLGELDFLRAQGWDHDILAHARTGGRVLGLCGGLQMLGQRIADLEGVDGPPGMRDGLGLLDIETHMAATKQVRQVKGTCAATGLTVGGYEIHAGHTQGADLARPFIHLEDGLDGARSADGRIEGTYLHGIFSDDAYRAAWCSRIRSGWESSMNFEDGVDKAIDALADGLEAALDIDRLFALARPIGWSPSHP